MTIQRIAGVVLLVVGIGLLVVGINASESMADQVSHFFTGRFTETTLWYLVGGAALAVTGLSLALFGGRAARA